MSTNDYLQKLVEKKETKKPTPKRRKIEEKDKEDSDIGSVTDEEIVEDEDEDRDKEEDYADEEEDEARLVKLWKWLSPPTQEEEIVGKWFAVVFKPESANVKKRTPAASLYIGKATTRFLLDADGPACGIEFDCLKLHVGSGTILESYTGTMRDISLFKVHDVIAGPLEVYPE
ncbi:uncharacterized protein LOC130636595 [Hydractinia symbiolongicarpus]|uniref:uncharacterized protein LOC130636595 n=1 Tax=Hydractinia symbiolongicarpus TaxID=13093 RepID=UPI00254C2E55|nr:uncharacterized protein LOC130636595 [Hydractinia symbiolongicarpus]